MRVLKRKMNVIKIIQLKFNKDCIYKNVYSFHKTRESTTNGISSHNQCACANLALADDR